MTAHHRFAGLHSGWSARGSLTTLRHILVVAGLLSCGVALAFSGRTAAAEFFDPAVELARQSGLPLSEVSALLANCGANQASRSFCAQRDLIVAERELHRIADQWEATSPACSRALDRRLKQWQESRDRVCKKTDADGSANGLMHSTAQAICETSMTQSMTERIRERGCR
jgi:hypothetical protein